MIWPVCSIKRKVERKYERCQIQKKRILNIKNRLTSDGVAVFFLNNVKQLQDEYIFDWLVTSADGNNWTEKFEPFGSVIYHIDLPHNKNPITRKIRTLKAWTRFFKEHRYDVIHINTDSHRRWEVLFCAAIAGIPHRIIHSHNISSETSSTFAGLPLVIAIRRKLIGAFGTCFIGCSQMAANWLYAKKQADNAIILKNGIDTERFRFQETDRITVRRELGLEDHFLLGHVGRMAKAKNHRFLIQVFQKVHDQKPDARLLLIGEGELESEIRETVQELGLQNEVIFLGTTDHVEKYLSSMDVFVMPSLTEGFSIAGIEAQANGLPCIYSDNVPKATKLSESVEFLPLELGADAWAERILLTEFSENRKNAYKTIAENGYDIKASAQALRRLYDSMFEKEGK